MARDLIVVDGRTGTRREPAESFAATLPDGPEPIVLMARSAAESALFRDIAQMLPHMVEARRATRHEGRIEALLDILLDADPLSAAEASIDRDNAELRREFLERAPVLDAATIHDRAGHTGRNKAQTAANWRRAGRILGLPHGGRLLYPAFQFDPAGQPFPIVADILKALPQDWSPWQRAIWFVAPNEWIDGTAPVDALATHGPLAVEAAHRADDMPAG